MITNSMGYITAVAKYSWIHYDCDAFGQYENNAITLI